MSKINQSDFASSFMDVPEELTTQIEVHMKLKFLRVATRIRSKPHRSLDFLDKIAATESIPKKTASKTIPTMSQLFLQNLKYDVIDFSEKFEMFSNELPVFGYNSSKNGINFIKPCFLPIHVEEGDTKLIAIRKASQIVLFKFQFDHLFEILRERNLVFSQNLTRQ